MIYRSKAPLRIGLAGGGTDVSPYSDLYGGAILNATVSLYAYANIEPLESDEVVLKAIDYRTQQRFTLTDNITTGELPLHLGVFNRMKSLFPANQRGFRLSTFVDAPAGSGLGTSSTLVVAIVGAFAEMLKLPLGEYDIAHLAHDIERKDLKMAGGKQDQYAATFGGVNFMEFYAEDKVIVNPLRVKQQYLFELENNLVLYYTDTNRESAKIIEQQRQNVLNKDDRSIEAMHQLKNQSQRMKEALLMGRLHEIGEILDFGFQQKRRMAAGISNDRMESIYAAARTAGATGGKISGAGGGGFMIFYCPGNSKFPVMEALKVFGGHCKNYQFVDHGLTTWTN